LAETLINGGKEQGAENRIAMAISGDNEQSKKIISSLANDAGSLSESWRHQPGIPAVLFF